MNCLVENPAFDSQTKETLTTKEKNFGSKVELTKDFTKRIMESGVVNQIISQVRAKLFNKMAKNLNGTKKGRITGISKLDDANDAGKISFFNQRHQKCFQMHPYPN